MSTARKAALHLLNGDWSRAVWKHWLANIFQPPVEPPIPASAPPPSPAPEVASAPMPSNGPASADVAHESLVRDFKSRSEPPDSSSAREARRLELRARFDALSDRLMAVEDGLDTLLRRSAQRDKLERRSDQQSVEMIDNVALAGGRQAAVLEGLLNTVSRLEHAVSRLESGLSRVGRALGGGERGRRDSHFPGAGSQPPPRISSSQFPESVLAPRERVPTSSRASDVGELEAH